MPGACEGKGVGVGSATRRPSVLSTCGAQPFLRPSSPTLKTTGEVPGGARAEAVSRPAACQARLIIFGDAGVARGEAGGGPREDRHCGQLADTLQPAHGRLRGLIKGRVLDRLWP